MFLRISIGAAGAGRPAAAALRTEPNGIVPTAASPPTARPERFRKVRRSRVPEARPAVRACSLLRLASPLLRLISMGRTSLLQGLVTVGPIEGLHVIGLAIAALCLVGPGIVGLRFRRPDRRRCGRDRDRRRAAEVAKEVAAVHRRLALVSHLLLLQRPGVRRSGRLVSRGSRGRPAQDSIAKACASISMNRRPTVPAAL